VSETLDLVRAAVAAGEVRVSQHAIAELNADAITLDDILDGAPSAIAVEDYPSACGKAPAFSPCTVPATAERFMWYGVLREGRRGLRYW
jgi:hypothetical protein